MKGLIIKYIDDRGFGFIKGENEDIERFFHIRDVKSVEPQPAQGLPVEFTPSNSNKGSIATDVCIQAKPEIICEKCGYPMVERKGPRGVFLGCSNYPRCNNTKTLNESEKPTDLNTVVLISCTDNQRDGRWKARDLYNSESFKESLDFAGLITDSIFVISSAHGLVDLDTELENYNVRQDLKSQEELDKWGSMVANQINERGINIENTEFIILAWRYYYKPLLKHLKYFELPLYKISPRDKSAKLKELLKERGK